MFLFELFNLLILLFNISSFPVLLVQSILGLFLFFHNSSLQELLPPIYLSPFPYLFFVGDLLHFIIFIIVDSILRSGHPVHVSNFLRDVLPNSCNFPGNIHLSSLFLSYYSLLSPLQPLVFPSPFTLLFLHNSLQSFFFSFLLYIHYFWFNQNLFHSLVLLRRNLYSHFLIFPKHSFTCYWLVIFYSSWETWKLCFHATKTGALPTQSS